MLRKCNGADPNLRIMLNNEEVLECANCNCGLEFDDVERSTIYPHKRIPTRAEKEAIFAQYDEYLSGLTPELDDKKIALQAVTEDWKERNDVE